MMVALPSDMRRNIGRATLRVSARIGTRLTQRQLLQAALMVVDKHQDELIAMAAALVAREQRATESQTEGTDPSLVLAPNPSESLGPKFAEDLAAKLVEDMRAVFGASERALHTSDIVSRLSRLDDWSPRAIPPRGISPHMLARWLRPLRIGPTNILLWVPAEAATRQRKGYYRAQFEPLWNQTKSESEVPDGAH